MTSLDESSIIRIFQNKLSKKTFVSEDVEVFKFGKNHFAAKTDTLVESTDIPTKLKIEDAARKSIIACVSDFAAKCIKPQYGIISINLPKTITTLKIQEIVRGLKKACDEYNISILGGDTNEGKEIVFNVCIFVKVDTLVRRNGAKKGDLVFVSGPFGYTAAGLKFVLGAKAAEKKLTKKSINAFTKPNPKLKFALKNRRYFSSSMDSSDGLSVTLNELSKQSRKRFVITTIPTGKDLQDYVRTRKIDLYSLVFYGGEEYEFVFTIPPKYKKIIKKNAKLLKTPVIEIGYVDSGNGVFLQEDTDRVILKDSGWKHFT